MFCARSKSVNRLKRLNPTILTLANNHILDQGIQGLKDTIKILNEQSISYVGVGENDADFLSAYYVRIGNKIIGLFGCAEHEYTIATNRLSGNIPFESLDISNTIRSIKEKRDFLIVLYHGGNEDPSPELRRRWHKMVDCGADIIICQHSHSIGAFEEYKQSGILYG
ncbi:MAG: CapA family protein [Oscillospiraceae bacterium]